MTTLSVKSVFFVFLLSGLLSLASCTSTAPKTAGIDQPTSKAALDEKFRDDYDSALRDMSAKQYQRASSGLNRVMANNPGYLEGWCNLALAYLRSGDIPQAKQAADKAAQLQQRSAPLENLLGLISVEDGAYKTAEQHYIKAITLDPSFANAHYNLALLNDIFFQDIAKAVQHYERYLSLIRNADPDTEAWVVELKRNLP